MRRTKRHASVRDLLDFKTFFFREITLIISQTSSQLLYFLMKCKIFGKWQNTKI